MVNKIIDPYAYWAYEVSKGTKLIIVVFSETRVPKRITRLVSYEFDNDPDSVTAMELNAGRYCFELNEQNTRDE